jgi:hypothetical protein
LFERLLETSRDQKGHELAVRTDVEAIEAIIGTAFWASLRREEDSSPRISLVLLPPGRALRPLLFERPLPLDAGVLAKLALAADRPGIHVGVWRDNGEFYVWGTTRVIPPFCFVLEVVAPGLLVIKHQRTGDSGKFVNVAVLEGDQVKVLNQDPCQLPDCPALVTSLLGFNSPSAGGESVQVLVDFAVSMRAHGRGGSLLVVPANSNDWRMSIVHPIRYGVSPPFPELADLMREEVGERVHHRWQEALYRSIAAIAGLTAVDGATIITDQYELLAFGAKIVRRDGWPQVEQVIVTEPIEDAVARIEHPVQLGGTRHLSAAQFGQDQRDAVALVASQDGRFTIFAWSALDEMVHAHRVESLLL